MSTQGQRMRAERDRYRAALEALRPYLTPVGGSWVERRNREMQEIVERALSVEPTGRAPVEPTRQQQAGVCAKCQMAWVAGDCGNGCGVGPLPQEEEVRP